MPASRSSAESRYRKLRHEAFQEAEAKLTATGLAAELRPIGTAALEAFRVWSPRRVSWPWPQMVGNWRRAHPDRFELAVWRDGILCGLALGRPAPSAAHMSLYYLEGNPDPGHPLHFKVAEIAITALQVYAIAFGKTELRLVEPLPEAIRFYCSRFLGFELVNPRREAPYCRRSNDCDDFPLP